ncbi:hypothetical protein COHA_005368 [Chlorella ohadii]|uniref:sphinganine-1-phosphate aldolase n=1 Tax=Chlorella ohadii TaxID=2649997 RepID=A0AAD5H6B6_9CHLO|nr:hypothetical protein COHA_005368 [Chlorella ohadii]
MWGSSWLCGPGAPAPGPAAELLRHLGQAVEPAVEPLRPYVNRLAPLVSPALAAVAPAVRQAAAATNASLAGLEAWQLVVISVLATLLLGRLLRSMRRALRTAQDKGVKQVVAGALLDLPGVRGQVQRKQAELRETIREDLRKKSAQSSAPAGLRQLPRKGAASNDVKRQLLYKQNDDCRFADGDSRVSGTVYMAGAVHKQLLNEAYQMFSITNPMHADVFPSVRKMEGEVVAMTASMLGGGPAGDPGVCGSMTSGGTESILTAVKASRDYMMATRGITEPEMIIAVSAHAAFIKAAASAPGFPHGLVDHVADIAKVTRRRGVPLHVDCCLGGFVLPFARQLGYPVPPFDFSVPGVTSISVDTHKFGMAHKGTSVVLYRSAEIRKHQYTSITDWTGGLYISPGFAGSRSGALIATAWASMVHLGEEGYLQITDGMMKAAKQLIDGVQQIEGLEVVGQPEMSVVAFKATRAAVKKGLDIYKVNDLLSKQGWHLNALQRPAALHICITAAHSSGIIELLLRDLREAVATALQDPSAGGEGTAPLYGMAAVVPDRRIVAQFLTAYQDALLEGI